jgi:S-adenosylmethionine uptake transporter
MRTGEVAYVVPFRYTSLLWAIALGYLVFGEVPDKFTLIGSAIVIATGLFTLYREMINNRRAVTSTTINASGNAWHENQSSAEK